MPVYEYKCDKCQTELKKLVGFKIRKNPMQCTVCKSGQLVYQPKLTKSGFRLQGDVIPDKK